jgi:hypothetical protein
MFNRSIDVFQKSWLTSILAIPSSLAFHFAEPASIRQLGEKIQYSRDRPVHSPSGAINGAKRSSANLVGTKRRLSSPLSLLKFFAMLWGALLSLVAVAPSAHALLRFACSQLVTQRFDP